MSTQLQDEPTNSSIGNSNLQKEATGQKTKSISNAFGLFWLGENVFSLDTEKLWNICSMLQKEGVESTCYNYKNSENIQFPMVESSSIDVMVCVASLVRYGTQMQTTEETNAIINLYNNSDSRLIKINNN